MTMRSIETGDGCRIAFRVDGLAGAPVLALSNSLGTTAAMWDGQIDLLSRDFRVLRYDGRGHGASDAPAGAYGMDRLGRDVIELLDALGIGQVHFCGLSLGGMIGQWLGVRASDRLLSLTICNSSAYMGPPSAWDARIATVRDGGMAAIADAVLDRWFTPGFRNNSPQEWGKMRDMVLATDPAGYAGCCAAIRDMDMRPLLGMISTPTLVVGGSEDPATPLEHAELLARSIPGARLVVLPTAHLSSVELPADVARTIRAHMEEATAPSALGFNAK